MTSNGNSNGQSLVRQDFGGQEIQHQMETAATAVAAQARAAIESRYVIAMRQPRDLEVVRVHLLKECENPKFAEVARYHKPIGKGIEGPSIRFVEAALQCLGNVDTQAVTIYDDQDKRIIEIQVSDFERNVTHRKQITVTKTVERRSPKGYDVVGKRSNKFGDTVYVVRATDDDLLNKEAALVSKALRTCGLRLIPGWLVDEAMDEVLATQSRTDAQDPKAALRRMIDSFAGMGIEPGDLSELLGHDLGKVTPAEMTKLRGIYATIQAEETTWTAVMDKANEDKAPAKAKAKARKGGKGASSTKDAIRKRATKAKTRANEAKQAAEPEAPPVEVVQTEGPPPADDMPPWMTEG
jgi:hypothetical protein